MQPTVKTNNMPSPHGAVNTYVQPRLGSAGTRGNHCVTDLGWAKGCLKASERALHANGALLPALAPVTSPVEHELSQDQLRITTVGACVPARCDNASDLCITTELPMPCFAYLSRTHHSQSCLCTCEWLGSFDESNSHTVKLIVRAPHCTRCH